MDWLQHALLNLINFKPQMEWNATMATMFVKMGHALAPFALSLILATVDSVNAQHQNKPAMCAACMRANAPHHKTSQASQTRQFL